MADVATPVVVNGNPVPAQIMTALQYIISTGGAFAIGKGWLTADTLSTVGGILLWVAPIVYGIWKTGFNAKKLLTVIFDSRTTVPSSVAQVK